MRKSLGRRVSRVAAVSLVALPLALASATAPVASAQEMPAITVAVAEYQFTPSTITLTQGVPIQLNVQNKGGQDHSFLSDIPVAQVHYVKADNSRGELQGYEANNVINADAGSGHTSVVTFTPTKAGTYQFHSEDEEDLGLVGSFVVVETAGQTAAPAAPAAAAPAASSTVARDGQSLASQSAATQSLFMEVWGDRAAQEWVQEHNAGLPK